MLTYRRQEPRLTIEVKKCIHNYKEVKPNVKELVIYSFFQISNKGDRRTKLLKVQFVYWIVGKKHKLRTAFIENNQVIPESTKWVEAHDIINVGTYSAETTANGEKEKIECIFTIFHTHGAKEVKTTSIRQELFSVLRDYFEGLP